MSSAFSGAALVAARQRASLRVEHLALAVNRSAESIRAYEAGRVDPPASVVAALAECVGVSPGDLFEPVAVAS